MEMRRNNSLSHEAYWLNSTPYMCQNDPRTTYVAPSPLTQQIQGKGHCRLSYSAGTRGSGAELWSHTLVGSRGLTAQTHGSNKAEKSLFLFSEKTHQADLKTWLPLGSMSCQISTWKFAWITIESQREAADITDDWWWRTWQLLWCHWWRCCHGKAWSRETGFPVPNNIFKN